MTGFEIVRLQVQLDRLKPGRAPWRRYDPTPIESVPRLEIGPQGAIGLGRSGGRLLDVHHTDHPHSRDPRGRSGLTFMGTGDYTRLRERYGPHLVEGIAGESILLDVPEGLAGRDLPATATLRTAGGSVDLVDVRVAAPCVEFSRFCLGLEPSPEVGDDVRQTLQDLDGGARGYRAVAAGPMVLALGDVLELDV